MVRRVAICTGSGRSLIDDALAADADVYITADLRYNDFMCGEGRMVLMDIGHFESEFCAIRILHDVISKKCVTLPFARAFARETQCTT